MSDFEWSNVQSALDYLEKIGVEVEPAQYDDQGNEVKPAVRERQLLKIPRCRKALKRWGRRHQDHYLQNQENPAEDHFFRRAAMLGFHAAMVAYMCNGCKETKEVIDFALWVAEYILQSQLLFFGNEYNSIYEKRVETRTDNAIRQVEIAKFNLLDALPEEFTVEDMNNVGREHGKVLKNPYHKIICWKKTGMVREIPTDSTIKKWRKLTSENTALDNENVA